MRNFSRLGAVVALLAFFMFLGAPKARAQFVFSDPITEGNTLAMHIEQLMQYVQEAQTALSTYQHLMLMEREVQQLVTHPSTNIAMDLATFSNVLQQSQGLALNLAQMDATFRSQFAPYSPSPLVNYSAQYNTWATTALNSIHAAANSAGYQGNMLQNEQQFMQQMNQMNQMSNGEDQSLQIGNSIGLETVAQLQKLRMLVVTQMGQQAVVATTALNAQQAAVTTSANAFTNTGSVADQRGW